jgi:hypothetical protein
VSKVAVEVLLMELHETWNASGTPVVEGGQLLGVQHWCPEEH